MLRRSASWSCRYASTRAEKRSFLSKRRGSLEVDIGHSCHFFSGSVSLFFSVFFSSVGLAGSATALFGLVPPRDSKNAVSAGLKQYSVSILLSRFSDNASAVKTSFQRASASLRS